jgi:serine/threonine protein kinase
VKKGLRILCNDEIYIVSQYSAIGGGSFGNVWKAKSEDGTDVAIKFLKDSKRDIESSVARFESEAKKMSELRHSNIVRVYGLGTSIDDRADFKCYVMELLDCSLADKLKDDSSFSAKRLAKMIHQVGSALTYAYSKGVTAHADLQPGNILLDENLDAKIADFGMMKSDSGHECAAAASIATYRMSLSEMTGARNKYSAPEVLEQGSTAATELSDMCSLGRIGFEMLEKIYGGKKNPLYKHIDSVLAKAVLYRPVDRFKSMDEFVHELNSSINRVEETDGANCRDAPYLFTGLAQSLNSIPRKKLAIAAAALLALCVCIPIKACGSGGGENHSPEATSNPRTVISNEYNVTYNQTPYQPPAQEMACFARSPPLEQNRVVIPSPETQTIQQPVQPPLQQIDQEAAQQRDRSAERPRPANQEGSASRPRRRSNSEDNPRPSRQRRTQEEQQPPGDQPIRVYIPSSERRIIPCYRHNWPEEGVIFEDEHDIVLIRRDCELIVLETKQRQ